MKRDHEAYLDDLDVRELDRLVLNELEALKRVSLKAESHHIRVWGQALYMEKDDEGATKGQGALGLAEKRIGPPEQSPEGVLGPYSRELENRDGLEQSESETQVSPKGLLQEEEKFISRVVAWLRPRENKDVLLARIWSSLGSSEPGTFSSPDSESDPDSDERLESPETEVKPATEATEIE